MLKFTEKNIIMKVALLWNILPL